MERDKQRIRIMDYQGTRSNCKVVIGRLEIIDIVIATRKFIHFFDSQGVFSLSLFGTGNTEDIQFVGPVIDTYRIAKSLSQYRQTTVHFFTFLVKAIIADCLAYFVAISSIESIHKCLYNSNWCM